MGVHTNSLEDLLQAEFSPPLDSSLIAAIVADYASDTSSQPRKGPTSQEVQNLRAILSELAAQAERDEDAISQQLSDVHFFAGSITDDTSSAQDFFSKDTTVTTTTTTESAASDASGSSQPSFSSPLGFLQAAFPHLPLKRLRSALNSMGDLEDIDMEAIVESVLSGEYVRELEERGLDGLDDGTQLEMAPWQTVEIKKKAQTVKVAKKQKRGTTISLVDIRQKQHARPAPVASSSSATPLDPWTQMSSFAAHLETLLPSKPASYFQSIFHSPDHASPSAALRAALSSMSPYAPAEPTSEETPFLFGMFDVLNSSSEFATFDDDEREQLMSDALLALRASCKRPDAALDIVWLLRDLDSDSTSGEFEWGVYHSRAQSSSASPSPFASNAARKKPKNTLKLPSGPPSIAAPPKRRSPLSPVSPSSVSPWKTVTPTRKTLKPSAHPLADFIPAYNTNGVPGKKARVRGAGNGLGKGGKGDVGELSVRGVARGGIWEQEGGGHARRAAELFKKQNEALREASRAWQRGNTKTRGGEVAVYFAEKARQLFEQAQREKLISARDMVRASRTSTDNGSTIDLHGTTVAEAKHIVIDILQEEGASPARPLKIITGRGTHSVNGIGVLGPAVKAALSNAGWNVGTWDAGLVVRGRLPGRAYS